jgi:fatty acid desaturase
MTEQSESAGCGTFDAATRPTSPAVPAAIEIPTLAVAVAVYGGFALLTWFFRDLPLWIAAPFGSVLIAWHGSFQHETIHGHPTASRRLNALLAWPPLALWIPYEDYRRLHLLHHRYGGRRLTYPGRDPESFYLAPGAAAGWGPIRRAVFRFRSTLAGRLLIGPAITMTRFWVHQLRALPSAKPAQWAVLFSHALGLALVLGWVVGICGIPLWVYVLLIVYPSVALSQLRSFVEHRYDEHPQRRTAVVEAHPFFALLFLNNNLHVAHHQYPTVSWYRLPQTWRAMRAAAERHALFFPGGYTQVFREYALRSFIPLEHPDTATSGKATADTRA